MLTFGDPAAAGRCGGAARYRAGITHQLTDAWHRYRLTRNDMERALIDQMGRVPQPHRPVVAGAGQGPAVRGERHRVHQVGVPGQFLQLPAGGRVPQPHRHISTTANGGTR